MFSAQVYTAQLEAHPTHILTEYTSERSLLLNVLHMLQGMPSHCFPLCAQPARFSLPVLPLELPHLSSAALKPSLTQLVAVGNLLLALREQSALLYAKGSLFLRALGEGVNLLLAKVAEAVTACLQCLQQQSGGLARNEQQYQASRNQPVTLASVLGWARSLLGVLGLAATLLARVSCDLSTQSQANSVCFLLDCYYTECEKEWCGTGAGKDLHLLFGPLLTSYFGVVEQWLAMDEVALAVKASAGFFAATSGQVAEERVPKLLKGSYRQIVELGRTVQFIKLYFGEEERLAFRQYLGIEAELAPLRRLLASLAPLPTPFFQPAKVKHGLLSQKLKTLQGGRPVSEWNPADNPCQMYTQTQGAFQLKPRYSQPNPTLTPPPATLTPLTLNYAVNAQLCQLLAQMTERIAGKCRALLRGDRIRGSLERTMSGIWRFMLLGQGDFAQELLEGGRELLGRPADKISRNNMERLIEEALRCSGGKLVAQTVRERVSFEFLESGLKGWRSLAILYLPEPPTDCLFTPAVMRGYSEVSRVLFNLRHCEEELVDCWQQQLREGMAAILQARNAVHHFLKALQAYLFAQMHAVWSDFQEAVNTESALPALIEANSQALSKIRALTVESKPLANCLMFLVKAVERFQSMRNAQEEDRQEAVRADLEQIWKWFMAVLEQAKQIGSLADTFDFRTDYRL